MTSGCSVPDNYLLLGSLCSPADRMMARSSASEGPQSRFNVSIVNRIATDEHARRSYYSSCVRPVRPPIKSFSDYGMCCRSPGTGTYEVGLTRGLNAVREIEDTISNTCRKQFNDEDMYERETDLPIDRTFVSPADFKKYHPYSALSRPAPVVPSAMYDHDGKRQYYRDTGNTHWMIVPPGPRFRTCYPQVWDTQEASGTQYDEEYVKCVKKQFRGNNDRFVTSPRYRYQTCCNIMNDTVCSAPINDCCNPVVEDTCCAPASTGQAICGSTWSGCKKKCVPVNRRKYSADDNSTITDEIAGKPLGIPPVSASMAADKDKVQNDDDCKSRPKVLVLTEKSDNKCGYPKTLVLWEAAEPDANINFSSNLYTVLGDFSPNDAGSAMNRSNSAKGTNKKVSRTPEVMFQDQELRDLLRLLSILDRDHEQMDEFLFNVFSRGNKESAWRNYNKTDSACLPIIKLEGEIISDFSPCITVENTKNQELNSKAQLNGISERDQTNSPARMSDSHSGVEHEFSPVSITIGKSIPTASSPPPLTNRNQPSCEYPETVFIRRRKKSRSYPPKSCSPCSSYYDRHHKNYGTTSSSSSSSSSCEIKVNDSTGYDRDLHKTKILYYHVDTLTDTSDAGDFHTLTLQDDRDAHRLGLNRKAGRKCKTSASENESWPTRDVVFTEWYNSQLNSTQPIWEYLNAESSGSSNIISEGLNAGAGLLHNERASRSAVKKNGDQNDVMNKNWNANDVNPSSSSEQNGASNGTTKDKDLQKFSINNSSQNTQGRTSGESMNSEAVEPIDADDISEGRSSMTSSHELDDDLHDVDSEIDLEALKERMESDPEYARDSAPSLLAARQSTLDYTLMVPEKKDGKTFVRKPSVRISLPHESDLSIVDTDAESHPKPAGHSIGKTGIAASSERLSQTVEPDDTGSSGSQARRSTKLDEIPVISLSLLSGNPSRASDLSNTKSVNSESSKNLDSNEQQQQQQQQQRQQGHEETERALREFASVLVTQLYAAIKEKTERNLNEDKTIPEQRMKFIKEKIDEEIQVCLLPILVEHIIWLIRQDLETSHEDERWYEKVDAEMIEDYVDLVVTNTTLVAHEQIASRKNTKSYVAASNCHCNLVDMIEKYNQLKSTNPTP